MSRGFFDWVPENIGYKYLRMAVSVEIDFNKLAPQMRKKLRIAIETGILPSYSGQLAAIYRTVAYHYEWGRPHLWTTSQYAGCRFYVPRQLFNEKIAPYLVMLCNDDQTPRHVGNMRTGYGTIGKVEGPDSLRAWQARAAHVKATGKMPTPDAIVETLVDNDQRPRQEVDEVLDLIDQRSKGYYKTLIS